jgi:hypothetical protein
MRPVRRLAARYLPAPGDSRDRPRYPSVSARCDWCQNREG